MKLQKILTACLLVAAVALVGISVLPTNAQAATDGYYTYTVSGGKATITDCDTSISGSVTIPSTLGGYPVTRIGDMAFAGCRGLTSITIPEVVIDIGSSAFSNCSSLGSITIPEGVTSIGDNAFSDCSSLTSITIPNSVTIIGDDAFYKCSSLQYNTYDNAKYLGNPENLYAALVDTKTKDITSCDIYPMTRVIVGYAFSHCSSLESITIPESVTYIGSSAFLSCSSLKGIWIAAENENYASDDRGVLFNKSKTELIQAPGAVSENYVIPEGVTSIGSYAFSWCSSLERITIPTGVTSIEGFAFHNCSRLTSITIPEGVTSIGKCVFSYCSSLESIIIPEGVTSIGDNAFSDCSSLTSITIPAGVTSIGSWAFYNCSSLTSITIPEDVTSIEGFAFYNCSSLKDVYYAADSIKWSQISIGISNYFLTNATIHYNHIHDYSLLPPVTVAATCTENGYTEYTCVHGDAYSVVIPATGHSYIDGVCVNCGGSDLPEFTGDGGVTDADAIYLLRYTLFPDSYPLSGNGDVNCDGQITDADAIYLLRHTLFPENYPLYPKKEEA